MSQVQRSSEQRAKYGELEQGGTIGQSPMGTDVRRRWPRRSPARAAAVPVPDVLITETATSIPAAGMLCVNSCSACRCRQAAASASPPAAAAVRGTRAGSGLPLHAWHSPTRVQEACWGAGIGNARCWRSNENPAGSRAVPRAGAHEQRCRGCWSRVAARARLSRAASELLVWGWLQPNSVGQRPSRCVAAVKRSACGAPLSP